MSTNKLPRLPPDIRRELEGTDWDVTHGKKHWQIRIAGQLVGIWPHGTATNMGKNNRGLRADIRNFKKQYLS